MSLRLLIQDEVVYEGDSIPVPRVGEVIHHGGQVVPIESVTWDFGEAGTVTVTLLVGSQPYTF
jgi:hypothetical protein